MELLRLLRAPSTLLSVITIILASTNPTLSSPLPEEAGIAQALNITILEKRCDGTPCGWGSLCCGSNQYCYTDSNNEAQCGDGASGTTAAAAGASTGFWQYYTSTWIETDTITHTSVYSSWVASSCTTAVVASATPSCDWSLNEAPCGAICCASGQYCLTSGQCAAAGGGSSGYNSLTASAPLRPTSQASVLATQTVSPTTTVPFETPVATGANMTLTESSTGGGGLSGGAIAGIVIGVIAAIIILALLCFFFCLDALLGLIGLGGRRRRRREEEVYVEEHRHRSHSGRGDRSWYGNRPTRIERTERIERRGPAWAGALGLGTMAATLGFRNKEGRERKEQQRRRRDEKSDVSYSYDSQSYSYDGTSASE
ncbi:MAG: hypothetical protein M1820_000528 [Bogoriella megaspora]|nr:MAG: hypothetical protein M1820_000528 [Bogoriella megaspora]